MPMTHAQLERLTEQNSNDIIAIYDMIVGITAKLEEHDARFETIDARLDGIDGRLDGIDGRLDGIDGRLDSLTGLVGEILTILTARADVRPARP